MPTSNPPLPRKPLSDDAFQRPDWTKVARDTKDVIALDKNENLDSRLKEIIADIIGGVPVEAVMEYPECAPYYHRLAKHLGIKPECLLFTPGSDGAIRTVFETFLSPGQTVLQTKPSFAMYPIYTEMYGGNVIGLNYKESPSGPILAAESVCESIKSLRPRLFCMPNPDSPTGTIFGTHDLARIVAACEQVDAVALIDEAYYPFSNISAIPLIDQFQNLVVAQTFAKGWGLAGLRLGFAAAHPNMAALLHKVRPMYEVNGLALAVMDGLIVNFDDPCLAGFSRFTAGTKAIMVDISKIIEHALD